MVNMLRLGYLQRGSSSFIFRTPKTSWSKCGFYFKSTAKSNCLVHGRLSTSLVSSHSYNLYPAKIEGCSFHTSQRHNIHPALWMLLKPVFKISAALTGRGVRKWYRGMNSKDKKSFWTKVKERWYLFVGAAGVLAGSFVIYYQSHIQEAPITGRKRFIALTHDQILSISQTEAQTFIDQYKDKMLTDETLQTKRVLDVAIRLLMANPELKEMSFKKWEVFVVQDPLVNAFVLPSGHVFVFEGMLDIANTQDQLAIILGHEMAHALLEHGIEELSYSQFIDYIVIVLMAALWCIIPIDGIALVTHWYHSKVVSILTHLPHSRALETEADKVGAMLAAKACYDIRQGTLLWQKMEASQKITSVESLPTFLSTHPQNLRRAEFFDFIIPQAEKWRDEQKCPIWPLKDPREVIPVLSQIVDNHIAAIKTGQNLNRVQLDLVPKSKAVGGELRVSKTVVDIIDKSMEQSSVNTENKPLEFKSKQKDVTESTSPGNGENKVEKKLNINKATVAVQS